jgi:hypothetical protein
MESRLKSKEKIILGVSLALVFGALAAGIFGAVSSLVQTSRTISNVGSVKGIGVGIYWNSACTNSTSSINWGLLDPGSNKTVTVYVRNEGNTLATLSKTTGNWNPSTASSYLSLNWDYTGQTLSLNQVLPIKLTLTVSSTISGITNFSFDITITAAG